MMLMSMVYLLYTNVYDFKSESQLSLGLFFCGKKYNTKITDMFIVEKMVLSDMIELLSHAYEVLKLNRQWMNENWWLF